MDKFRENNPNWRGGRSKTQSGYIVIRVGKDHHLADCRGYAYEHRIVAEESLGRKLKKGEIVHHIDGNKENNSPDNLQVVSGHTEHRFIHRSDCSKLQLPGEKNKVVFCACGCGESFDKYDSSRRPRSYISGHNDPPSPAADSVLAALSGGAAKRLEISKACGKSANHVSSVLWKLKQRGIVEKIKHGQWRLIDG